MDVLVTVLHVLVFVVAIVAGARLGGIGVGFAGGLGVLCLGLLGLKVDYRAYIPLDVVGIVLSVIAAIAAVQASGGLDVLVNWGERLLRRHPKYITVLAPLMTYCLTLVAGTGSTTFSLLPAISAVAEDNDVRPVRPLSISVVASQVGVAASPVSAATVWLATELENRGVANYLQLILTVVPSTLVAVLVTACIWALLDRTPLSAVRDPNDAASAGRTRVEARPPGGTGRRAVQSLYIFVAAILAVVAYSIAISDGVGVINNPTIDRTSAIILAMLTAGGIIMAVSKCSPQSIVSASTFKSGMSALVCVVGIAWLGTVFVQGHLGQITEFAGGALRRDPWLLAAVLLLSSSLLYSQAATTKAMMPIAFAAGIPATTIVASYVAVAGLFILPTYPTVIAAVEMDETGSTRLGRYVFDHPFLAPGLLTVLLSVVFGFAISLAVFG